MGTEDGLEGGGAEVSCGSAAGDGLKVLQGGDLAAEGFRLRFEGVEFRLGEHAVVVAIGHIEGHAEEFGGFADVEGLRLALAQA